jgi:hypothetical protein
MAWPLNDLVSTNLNTPDGDPSLARLELLHLMHKVRAILVQIPPGAIVHHSGSAAAGNVINADTLNARTVAPGTVWTSSNDGAESGLAADILDGLHAISFLRKDVPAQVQREHLQTAVAAKSGTTGTVTGVSIALTGGNFSWWTVGAENSVAGFGGANTIAGVIGFAPTAGVFSVIHLDERYVAASPPYDFGDGEIPLFIEVMLDRSTLQIKGVSVAPDPVWVYNGPNRMWADYYVDKQGYKHHHIRSCKWCDVDKSDAQAVKRYLAELDKPQVETREITQQDKMRDRDAVPHSWFSNDLAGDVVVYIDPNDTLVEKLAMIKDDEDIREVRDLIQRDYLTFDNLPVRRKWTPRGTRIVKAKFKTNKTKAKRRPIK